MGWGSFIKRTIKKVTKPVTKVFKGVAKGISRVGKSVMRGVSRISKKLGPLGMIAMSVAMPYALSGLSSMVGTAGLGPLGMHPGTGLLGSKYKFLQAVGKVGNTIRNGYRIGSGKIASTFDTITNSIRKTFTKFSNPSGKGNWFTKVSEGAKNLYNSAKSVVTGQPKTGSVDVKGFGYSPHTDGITTSMKSTQAEGLLKAGQIDGSMLSGQSTFGSNADKYVTDIINKASENRVKMLDDKSLRYFNDLKGTGQFPNNQEILDEVIGNSGTKYQGLTDFDGYYTTDLSKTGDYTFNKATMRPNPQVASGQSIQDGSFTFNGNKTFDTPVGNVNKYKETIGKKLKSAVYNTAKDSLFKKSGEYEEFEPAAFEMTQGATTNDGYLPVLSSTDVKGSSGSDSYAQVFGTEAWQKLKNYHKHMNYSGSMDYYGS